LAGNPNTGKSVIFNYLTRLYVDVSNYPGTTVDLLSGRMGPHLVVDTPGVYGLSSFNDEERVARDMVAQADRVVNVVDAGHLERDLFLTLQLADAGVPFVVALNLMDEAEARGVHIDTQALAAALGVPVLPTVAVTGKGLDALKAQLTHAQPGSHEVKDLAASLSAEEGPERESAYARRRERANALAAQVIVRRPRPESAGERLGRLLLEPVIGLPVLFILLAAIYQLIGVVVAQWVVGFTEDTVMLGYYEPTVRALLGPLFGPGNPVGQLLLGEFGILTMTVTYLFGLLLPLVVAIYLAIAFLEDSGYMPRLAVLLDRLFVAMGLNGRAVIPVILGLGCGAMASMSTRVLGTVRERRIALFLLALAVPCSAQLGVVTAMMAGLGARYLVGYVLIVGAVFLVAGTLLNRILPGESSFLLIDLPHLRWPAPGNVLRKTFSRSAGFLKDAAPLFIFGALLVGVMQLTGALTLIETWTAPVTRDWLGLPVEASRAFIMGFIRRDFGAAGLFGLALPPDQILVAVVTITLFVPCIASILVVGRERGWREAAIIWLAVFGIAFLVGGVVHRLPFP
jgi:ferrous iron transport protein B